MSMIRFFQDLIVRLGSLMFDIKIPNYKCVCVFNDWRSHLMFVPKDFSIVLNVLSSNLVTTLHTLNSENVARIKVDMVIQNSQLRRCNIARKIMIKLLIGGILFKQLHSLPYIFEPRGNGEWPNIAAKKAMVGRRYIWIWKFFRIHENPKDFFK